MTGTNKCGNCGKKKARRLFCSYECYAKWSAKSGAWGKKLSPKVARGIAEKQNRYRVLAQKAAQSAGASTD